VKPHSERRTPSPARTKTTIKAVMTPTPHTIGSEQTMAKAHAMMRDHMVRHLPVIREGRLVGMLSQRDLYFLESISGIDPEVDVVADAMSSDVFTAAPDEKVADVVQKMAKNRYGCAVVVDRGHVIGVFTAADALQLLAEVL
jgi:acetoin utilization protein AcuB